MKSNKVKPSFNNHVTVNTNAGAQHLNSRTCLNIPKLENYCIKEIRAYKSGTKPQKIILEFMHPLLITVRPFNVSVLFLLLSPPK